MMLNVILEDYFVMSKDMDKFDTTALSIVQFIFMVFFLGDSILSILTFGIKKHLWHFVRFFEMVLVLALFVISIVELS